MADSPIAIQFHKSLPTLEPGGSNYQSWADRFKMLFTLAHLTDFVVAGEDKPAAVGEARDVWGTKKAQAFGYLVTKLSDDEMTQVGDFTAHETWDFLASKFRLSIRDTHQSILRTLGTLRAKNEEAILTYLNEHEQLLAHARKSKLPLVLPAAANADDAARATAASLHMTYSDRILEGLPQTTSWKVWVQIYRTDAASTFDPREVLDKIREQHMASAAHNVGTSSATNPLLPSSTTSSSSSGSALASPQHPASPQQKTKRTCSFCKKTNPRHSEATCWSNPSYEKNKLGGKGVRKVKGEKKGAAAAAMGEIEEGVKHIVLATIMYADDAEPWLIDSCASRHLTSHRSLFTSYSPAKHSLNTATGDTLKVLGIGTVELTTVIGGKKKRVILTDVGYAPASKYNLISVPMLVKSGADITFRKDGSFVVTKDGKTALSGNSMGGGLPKLTSLVAAVYGTEEKRRQVVVLAHRRFGHPGEAQMRSLLKNGTLTGFTITDVAEFYKRSCPVCRVSKSASLPFPTSTSRAKLPLEKVHADITGPFSKPSFTGLKFFLLVRDDATGWIDGVPMKDRTDVLAHFQTIYARMKNEFREKERPEGKALQTDRGTEFLSGAFQEFLRGEGITHLKSVAGTPQQNARIERAMRTVKEKTSSLLTEAGLGRAYSAEAFNYALFILNNLPYNPLDATPWSLVHTSPNPLLRHLPLFGQTLWAKIPSASSEQPRAEECIYLGVGFTEGTKAFRVKAVSAQAGQGVRWSRDVYLDRTQAETKLRTIDDDKDSSFWGTTPSTAQEEDMPKQVARAVDVPLPPSPVHPPSDMTDEQLSRRWGAAEGSRRAPKPTEKAAGAVLVAVEEVAHDGDEDLPMLLVRKGTKLDLNGRPKPTIPMSVEEALNGPWGEEWSTSMKKELKGHGLHDSFHLSLPLPGVPVIGSRWAWTIKTDEDGDPVELKIISIFFKFAAERKLPIVLTDFEQGYLAAEADFTDAPPLQVKPPPGIPLQPGDEGKIYIVNCAVYGLPPAGHVFNLEVRDWMDSANCLELSSTATVFIGRKNDKDFAMLLYIDDGLLAGETDVIEDFLGRMREKFDVKVRGPLDGGVFLGREMKQDLETGDIVVTVRAAIEKVTSIANLTNSKPLHLPIQPGIDYVDSTSVATPEQIHDYRVLLGHVNWIVQTRFDATFAFNVASRFASNPSPEHFALIHRIIRYLHTTKDVGMKTTGGNKNKDGLIVFIDSDFAGCAETRRSTTGAVFILNGSVVFTLSKHQATVATSTFRAELTATATAVAELEWIESLASSISFSTSSPIHLYNDNFAAVEKLNSPSFSEETKVLDVKV
ncbi:hypothetical protein JCM5296_004234 [Sporobolomyces johnsonii]